MKRHHPFCLPNPSAYARQGGEPFAWFLNRRNILSTIYGRLFP